MAKEKVDHEPSWIEDQVASWLVTAVGEDQPLVHEIIRTAGIVSTDEQSHLDPASISNGRIDDAIPDDLRGLQSTHDIFLTVAEQAVKAGLVAPKN